MAIIYALVCSWAVVLRKLAAWKHDRLKRIYEQAELAFQAVEQDCKSHEVALGGPADYHSQMKLLRLFDEKEQARETWMAADLKLQRRRRRERAVRKFTGKKLPYTFGLLDMALLFRFVDTAREFGSYNLASIVELIRSWIG
ncbi:MAG: hypothetical protein ACR2NP_05045 [Pirellulaceae bacterium]